MSLTLGEKLRQAREERGISISEVAENTRISPHYIKSIENDDYKPLPGGIFNKGFIKSYAKFIGIDEHEALDDYSKLAATFEVQEPENPRGYRAEVLTDDRQMEARAPTIIFAVIILGLMIAGILFVVKFLQGGDEQAVSTANTNISSNTPEANTAEAPEAAVSPVAPDRISIQLRAEGEPVWMRYTANGASKEQTLNPGESMTVEPGDSFSVSYSKAKAGNLFFTVNGKQVSPPTDTARGTIEFSINKNNIAEVMQTGTIPSAAAPPAARTPAPRPARTATPAAPATRPASTPRPPANANRG